MYDYNWHESTFFSNSDPITYFLSAFFKETDRKNYFIPVGTSATCTSRPLGMTDGSIRDWQLAASSAMSRADDSQ